ncbi:unnamed protein product, partial [Meganyctiphanes norvegica]
NLHDDTMVLIAMRLLCSILACLAIGVRSNPLSQLGSRSVTVTKAEVIPISSLKSLTSSLGTVNQISLGSPKHQANVRPNSRVPSTPHFNIPSIPGAVPFRTSLSNPLSSSPFNEVVNSPSTNAKQAQNNFPVIAFQSSSINDPSALAIQDSPSVPLFAHIPSHRTQAIPLFIHHAPSTAPTALDVGPTKDGQIHTSNQSIFNNPTSGGPISPITFDPHASSSGAQGFIQNNSPNPVLAHGKNSPSKNSQEKVSSQVFGRDRPLFPRNGPFTSSTSGSQNVHRQNIPINFPTPSSFPGLGRFENVNRSPFTALVHLSPSGQGNLGGVPVALFSDTSAVVGLSVGDFLPPGIIRK